MNITPQHLEALGVGASYANAWAEPMTMAANRFGLNSPRRAAAWLAQCVYESAGFRHVEESMYYTSTDRICAVFPSTVPSPALAQRLVRNPEALANLVYANKLGNGPVASGDGWRFRGRGPIQLTGRANYTGFSDGYGDGNDYTLSPDLVAEPHWGAMSAGWYWVSRGLNVFADAGDIDACTRGVNGPAMLGADVRRNLYSRALAALGNP